MAKPAKPKGSRPSSTVTAVQKREIESRIARVKRLLAAMRDYKRVLAADGLEPDVEDKKKESGLIKNLLSLERQLGIKPERRGPADKGKPHGKTQGRAGRAKAGKGKGKGKGQGTAAKASPDAPGRGGKADRAPRGQRADGMGGRARRVDEDDFAPTRTSFVASWFGEDDAEGRAPKERSRGRGTSKREGDTSSSPAAHKGQSGGQSQGRTRRGAAASKERPMGAGTAKKPAGNRAKGTHRNAGGTGAKAQGSGSQAGGAGQTRRGGPSKRRGTTPKAKKDA